MNRKKILVIDDDEELQELLKEHLNFLGYDTHSALNVEGALEKVFKEDFSLVILDLNFSNQDIDGRTFLSLLNGIKTKGLLVPPIIVMSSEDNQKTKDYVLKIGARAFVAKPYELNSLQEVIHEYIE